MNQIHFVCYARPEPQGSLRGFVRPGMNGPRAILTSNNKKMKPYRQELTHTAMGTLEDMGIPAPMADKHVPVGMVIDFYFARPPSIPKKRKDMVVKPDVDKTLRATLDALTGILYKDDAQIIDVSTRKHYGTPERVEISMTIL